MSWQGARPHRQCQAKLCLNSPLTVDTQFYFDYRSHHQLPYIYTHIHISERTRPIPSHSLFKPTTNPQIDAQMDPTSFTKSTGQVGSYLNSNESLVKTYRNLDLLSSPYVLLDTLSVREDATTGSTGCHNCTYTCQETCTIDGHWVEGGEGSQTIDVDIQSSPLQVYHQSPQSAFVSVRRYGNNITSLSLDLHNNERFLAFCSALGREQTGERIPEVEVTIPDCIFHRYGYVETKHLEEWEASKAARRAAEEEKDSATGTNTGSQQSFSTRDHLTPSFSTKPNILGEGSVTVKIVAAVPVR